MSGTNDETNSRGAGLEDVTVDPTFRSRSPARKFVVQLRRRWKMVGTVLVSAGTTLALYQVDGALTTDVWIFALLTAALLVYFLVTVRSDLELE